MGIHESLADPTLTPEGRAFGDHAVIKADIYLSAHTDEMTAERDRLLEAADAHSLAIADYISMLLRSYEDAGQAASAVLARAARR